MKLRFLLGALSFTVSASLVFQAGADPILPYQRPIAVQLTNDINGSVGDLKTLNSAVQSFHKPSKNLQGDTSILRSLDKLLAATPTYIPLLSNAASAYQSDFQGRRDDLYERLIPAGLNVQKTAARTALVRLDNALSNAVNATTTSTRITRLQTAASKLASASNAVQRALETPLGFSSMVAHIGALSFQSSRGSVRGGANFQTSEGTLVGRLTAEGTLDVSAFNVSSVPRGLSLHVEGIGTNYPALYPVGDRSFYGVTYRQNEYNFRSVPGLTNSVVTNAFVTIDFINASYILGRFAFIGTNLAPPLILVGTNYVATNILVGTNYVATNILVRNYVATNHLVTVSQGEFQLNLFR